MSQSAATTPASGGGAPEWLTMAAAAAAIALLIVIATFGWRRWRGQRDARDVAMKLRGVCDDMLTDVSLPDPELGQIHLGYVLFSRHGVFVVDVREVRGHVFGSETMQQWTVLDAARRYTFANPLPALHDRVAAIRRLLPEMPVTGCVAFLAGAHFSKGQPPHVSMLNDLVADIARYAVATDDMGTRQLLHPLWEQLKREVRQGRAG
jgi:hypothetical protein